LTEAIEDWRKGNGREEKRPCEGLDNLIDYFISAACGGKTNDRVAISIYLFF
jgi:hypothetical protein